LESLNKEKGKGSQARLRAIAEVHILKASPEYHPIDLSRLDPHVFIGFLCSLTDTKENEFNKSYGGHRSALTYLFTQTEITPPALFYQKLKQGMTGLKNKSAEARGDKGSKLSEGKEPMPFELYRALCKWLIEDGSSESMFGHCFLTLTWNLMCRSRNTVYIRLEHMGWENDAMTIQFAHTKTDRAGEDAGHKRHIYANPEMPEICPILSLGRYRLSFPGMDRGLLFSGASQYDRFRKLLKHVVTEHGDEIRRLGVDPDEIGVHSIRKGVATYCCNGTPADVSFPAVCIWADWSMGNIKDRYLHHALSGDRVSSVNVNASKLEGHLS
jgi:hypothetical protein